MEQQTVEQQRYCNADQTPRGSPLPGGILVISVPSGVRRVRPYSSWTNAMNSLMMRAFRDLPNAKFHLLDVGHWSLETTLDEVVALMLGLADQRGRANHQEFSQIPVAHLGDTAKPVFAAARVLRWREPQPGSKLSTGPELSRIGDRCRQRCGANRTDARNGRRTSRNLVASLQGNDREIDRLQTNVGTGPACPRAG
jgi:hypothetical protein